MKFPECPILDTRRAGSNVIRGTERDIEEWERRVEDAIVTMKLFGD